MIQDVLFMVALPVMYCSIKTARWYYSLVITMLNIASGIAHIMAGERNGAAISACVTVIWGYITYREWKNRNGKGKKRKSLRALGEKSLAKLREVVSKMPKPSAPRLIPAPSPSPS